MPGRYGRIGFSHSFGPASARRWDADGYTRAGHGQRGHPETRQIPPTGNGPGVCRGRRRREGDGSTLDSDRRCALAGNSGRAGAGQRSAGQRSAGQHAAGQCAAEHPIGCERQVERLREPAVRLRAGLGRRRTGDGLGSARAAADAGAAWPCDRRSLRGGLGPRRRRDGDRLSLPRPGQRPVRRDQARYPARGKARGRIRNVVLQGGARARRPGPPRYRPRARLRTARRWIAVPGHGARERRLAPRSDRGAAELRAHLVDRGPGAGRARPRTRARHRPRRPEAVQCAGRGTGRRAA